MSPLSNPTRLKEIRERSMETRRIASLPPIDPVTGKSNPFVVINQNDKDIWFLLDEISTLLDEVNAAEERTGDEEFSDLLDETEQIAEHLRIVI